jgi:hypothetical protein
MQVNDLLPEKYAQLGFHISNLGEHSYTVKYRDNTIVIFDSDSDLGDCFIETVCESYVSMISDAAKAGLDIQ